MKLLAVRMARSIWLVPQYFFNPQGIYTRPAIEALKARYSFIKIPPPELLVGVPPSDGIKFEGGAFAGKNGMVSITSVTLHADGLVVDTRSSTDDGDAFLEDATDWLSKEYGLPSYVELPIKRIYASELNVIFEHTPKVFDSRLASFLQDASSIIGDEKIGKTDFLGFLLATDPANSDRTQTFRFEREINTPFAENRFYSFAPIKTHLHVKLLEKLEQVAR